MLKKGDIFKKIPFLMVLFLTVCLALLSSCSKKQVDSQKSPQKTTAGNQWHEAPVLHELVEKGELPPLKERLPYEPYVQPVVDQIGKYGGTIRRAWRGTSDRWGVAKLAEEFLIKFSPDGKDIVPNVARKFQILNDSREFVFHLRKGLKWSDGDEFDADDIIFNWKHVILKEKVKPVNAAFFINDKICQVIKVDQYTVKVVFEEPYPLFPYKLIMMVREFYCPQHYAQSILPEFIGEERALEIAKAAGFTDIKKYIKDKLYYFWMHQDVPTLRAWIPGEDPSDQRWIMKRNPYYFKVDPEGNQLPYIDEIVHQFVEDNQLVVLKAVAGEVDFQGRGINAADYGVFMRNKDKGNYHIMKMKIAEASKFAIHFNQTTKDQVLRKIFALIPFRQAVSLAVDRDEINEIVFNGTLSPRQAATIPGGAYYDQEWENLYAQHDPQKANLLLDEIGLKWDSKKEFRLRPDGKVLEIILYARKGNNRDVEGTVQLLKKYFTAVGLKLLPKIVDRTYFEELRDNNDYQATIANFESFNLFLDPYSLIPLRDETHWCGQYGKYTETMGEQGEKPQGDIKKLVDYWNAISTSVDIQKRDDYVKKIIELHKKNLWVIGLIGLGDQIIVVNNNLKNVPEGNIHVDALRSPGNTWPNQFYFD